MISEGTENNTIPKALAGISSLNDDVMKHRPQNRSERRKLYFKTYFYLKH